MHLALQPDDSRTTAQQIAEQRLIPRALVRRVVTRLGEAGFITTLRGSDGGISLARPPADITLLQLVEALEGPLSLNTCTVEPEICPLTAVCSVHDAWVYARDVVRTALAAVDFATLSQTRARDGETPPEGRPPTA